MASTVSAIGVTCRCASNHNFGLLFSESWNDYEVLRRLQVDCSSNAAGIFQLLQAESEFLENALHLCVVAQHFGS